LSVAVSRGAHASTFLESSPLALDFSTISHSANVLPDGTVIVDAPLTDSAIGLARFSNFSQNPPLTTTASADNAGVGLEAFDGSDLQLILPFDQDILSPASVTVSTSGPGGIFPADLEREQRLIYQVAADETPYSETSDSALLIVTGLVFTLAGTVGRRPRELRRLNALGKYPSPEV
jgi:hypothetical protein